MVNATEFHWDGKDGVVRNSGKYGLLLSKPTAAGVEFDRVTYVSDGSRGTKVLAGVPIPLTEMEKQLLHNYAIQHAIHAPAEPDFGMGQLFPT